MTSNNKVEEINNLKSNTYNSKRAFSPALEEILFSPLKVLDHGFVRVIDYMGNDAAITQAARVSYGKGTKTLQNDKALIKYLMRHSHTSPFEMCEIKFHIKAPIFIARQWVRHRTANINEYSGRYSLMSEEYYIPEEDQLMTQSTDNKQGRENILSEKLNRKALKKLVKASEDAFNTYNELLSLSDSGLNQANETIESNNQGLARELARIILPLNIYTEFYWKIDLHNLLHFLFLRSHPHAQYEIRVYANLILGIIKKWVPIVYESFIEYKQEAIRLSKEAHKVINDILKGDKVKKENYTLSKREWLELEQYFDLRNRVE